MLIYFDALLKAALAIVVALFGAGLPFEQAGATNVIADASQALDYFTSKTACESVREETALESLAQLRPCYGLKKSQFTQIAELEKFERPNVEDAFFAALARQHATELSCGAGAAELIAKNDHEMLADVVRKLNVMRAARDAWVGALNQLRSDRTTVGRSCPSSLEELNDPNESSSFKALCQRFLTAKATYLVVENSIPLVGEDGVRNFAEKFADGGGDGSDASVSLATVFSQAGSNLRMQSSKLRTRVNAREENVFDSEEKHALLSDPRVVQAVVEVDKSSLKALACRSNARFGEGRDRLAAALGLGSLALGSGAMVFKGVAWAAEASSALFTARAAGQISMSAFRVLQLGAISASAATVTLDASRLCHTTSWKTKASAGSCVSTPRVEQLSSDRCALSAALTAINAASVVPSPILGALLLPLRVGRTAVAREHAANSITRDASAFSASREAEKAEATSRQRVSGANLASASSPERIFQIATDFEQSFKEENDYNKLQPTQLAQELSKYKELADSKQAQSLIESHPGEMDVAQNYPLHLEQQSSSLKTSLNTQVGGKLQVTPDEIASHPQDYVILYHGTTDTAARTITDKGIDFNRGNGEFGPGFYLTPSKVQAKDWADLTAPDRKDHPGKSSVLTYVIRKSDFLKAVARQSGLSFTSKETPFFKNFIKLNRKMRDSQGSEANPSAKIGVIFGPSVSNRKGVFDQIKFSNNEVNQALLSKESPALAIFQGE